MSVRRAFRAWDATLSVKFTQALHCELGINLTNHLRCVSRFTDGETEARPGKRTGQDAPVDETEALWPNHRTLGNQGTQRGQSSRQAATRETAARLGHQNHLSSGRLVASRSHTLRYSWNGSKTQHQGHGHCPRSPAEVSSWTLGRFMQGHSEHQAGSGSIWSPGRRWSNPCGSPKVSPASPQGSRLDPGQGTEERSPGTLVSHRQGAGARARAGAASFPRLEDLRLPGQG